MKTEPGDNHVTAAFEELERGVHAALEPYSNVHRGSGHNSIVSTHLFEQARAVIPQLYPCSEPVRALAGRPSCF